MACFASFVAAACARLRLLHYSQLFLSRYLIAIFRLAVLMPRPQHRLRARAGSELAVQTAIQLQILSVVMVVL
jgi:hypothetical protein